MINCPYCEKIFISWKSVRGHISSCVKNTKEYYIDLQYGPIHYKNISNITDQDFRKKYPGLKLYKLKDSFENRDINLNSARLIWSDQKIIDQIQYWYKLYNRLPTYREFDADTKYPHHSTVQKYFGSWNEAIKAAGFEPNYNDGFGNRTVAKDGTLYRSNAEAYFVNNHLYNKYDYIYEPKYENSNKLYDFYIPSIDLYIEIDGGLRPDIIKTKIDLNKKQNKKLLVVTDVYNFAGIAQG